MSPERHGIPKVLIDLPDERIVGGRHGERTTSFLGAGQRQVKLEVLRNDRSLAGVVAQELTAQSHTLHSAILAAPQAARLIVLVIDLDRRSSI